jgi:hypothetical protein
MAGSIANLAGGAITKAATSSPFAKVISGLLQGGQSGMPGGLSNDVAASPVQDGFNSFSAPLAQATSTFGAPSADQLTAYQNSIANIESKGSGDYSAVGPTTNGDKPLGRYQVMGNNVSQWTKDALGKAMTPEEFLANPAAQDATFNHKFGQYVDKYGPQGAAQAWLGGEGSVGKTDRKDVNGTSVGSYGQKFMAGLGQGSSFDRVLAAAQGKPLGQMAPGQPVGNGTWQTATAEQQQPKPKTTFDKIIDIAMKPHTPVQPVQAPQMQDGGPPEDTGAQEVATAATGLQQKKLQPNERSAQRKQALTARTRYIG